jgi:general secretion pathway protein A
VQPPASLEALADPIYEAFYGLTEQPFAISTDPKFLFLSESHRHGYEELLSGLRRREGLMLLSGETGTGKTTLCRALLQALGDRTFSAVILNPYMSGAEVLRVVLRDFGFVSREEIRRGALAQADVPQLLDALEGFLRALLPIGTYAVVVIDEAQSLAAEVLDQIRLLTAFEQNGQRLVQVMLVGQPQLLDTLKTESMYALNERLTRRVVLSPLTPGEVEQYIQHRLEIAGGAGSVVFEPDAARLVADLSRGLPRRVNVLCDRALQEGRIRGASAITADVVKHGARSLTAAPPPPPPEVEPPPVEPEAQATAAAVEEVSLTLGQAELPGRNRRLVALAGGGMLVAAAVLAYGLYASSVVGVPLSWPASPPAPRLDVGGPPAIGQAPTDDELNQWLSQQPGNDSAGSGQLPDNRHQLD